MNKHIFLLCYSLASITPLESMNKPPMTLHYQKYEVSRKIPLLKQEQNTMAPLSFFQEQPHWKYILNTPHAVKNSLLRELPFSDYKEYREAITCLVSAGGDPNTIPLNGLLPLAVALDHDDAVFTEFLLEQLADPNLFVNPSLIDIRTYQETGLHLTTNALFAGKPSFYFAKRVVLAQLCLLYGAQVDLNYYKQEHKALADHGNVLTHVIDNKDYSADLISFYLAYGAGPYHTSGTSNGGSTLHHLMQILPGKTDPQNIQRLLACTEYLIQQEPGLLKCKDKNQETPYDLLEDNPTITESLRQEFAQLFKQNRSKE